MRLRLACVSLPALALQVLLRREPGWRGLAAALIDRDEATGMILQANREARASGIRPGLTYSQALSLKGELRAGIVSSAELEAAREEVIGLLCGFSPEVEPSDLDAGAFWLNAAGMGSLYPTTESWIREVVEALAGRGLKATVVVGFNRFASYVVARSRKGSIELPDPKAELEAMRAAPVAVLPLPPPVLTLLDRLGVGRVGDFLDLPERSVRRRFGPEATRIFDRAAGELLPLQPVYPYTAARVGRRFDDPISDLNLLLPELSALAGELIEIVRGRQRLLTEITLMLASEDEVQSERIAPAAPTRNGRIFERLMRLRLAGRVFRAGVTRVEMTAAEADLVGGSTDLFEADRARARKAGARAFSLIRARLGNEAVRHAILRDDHLPERSFRWENLDEPPLPSASPRGRSESLEPRPFRVVRRMLRDPQPYAGAGEPDIIAGPFAISGRWWADERERSYYFARRADGEVIWIFREEESGRWMVQGAVD